MVKIENIKTNRDNTNFDINNILLGAVVSIITSLILLFIFSIVLVNTSVNENTIKPVVIILTAISILIGSSISTIKIKKNGIINGGIIGAIYILFIYSLSSIFISGFGLSFDSFIFIISAILTGMLGGIIGVNIH